MVSFATVIFQSLLKDIHIGKEEGVNGVPLKSVISKI